MPWIACGPYSLHGRFAMQAHTEAAGHARRPGSLTVAGPRFRCAAGFSNNIAFTTLGSGRPKLTSMSNATVGALVKRLRKRMRLTQEQFARELGVSFSTVNQWENDRRRPHPYLMSRLRELDTGSNKARLHSSRGGKR